MDHLLEQLSEALLASPSFDPADSASKRGRDNYDPEMLYVECRKCGKPIMWEPGRTTEILARSSISPGMVDECCMILSDGCADCSPYLDFFSLSIVRLAGLNAQDLLLMQKVGGHA